MPGLPRRSASGLRSSGGGLATGAAEDRILEVARTHLLRDRALAIDWRMPP
jgi:hypothetical protein